MGAITGAFAPRRLQSNYGSALSLIDLQMNRHPILQADHRWADGGIKLRRCRTNEVVGRRMDFSSDANADFEGLRKVNRGICMPQMAERRRPTRRRVVRRRPNTHPPARDTRPDGCAMFRPRNPTRLRTCWASHRRAGYTARLRLPAAARHPR